MYRSAGLSLKNGRPETWDQDEILVSALQNVRCSLELNLAGLLLQEPPAEAGCLAG